MFLPSELEKIIDEIEVTTNYSDRCELLIEWGDSLEIFQSELHKKPYPKENLVPGCESEVYMWTRIIDKKVLIDIAVENPQGVSAKALGAILQTGLKNSSIEEIRSIPEDIPFRIFGNSLSMGKGQGLVGMLRMLKFLVGQLKIASC